MTKQQLDVLTTLKRARRLIRKGWTRKAHARNRYGHTVHVQAPTAVRFCAEGALQRVAPTPFIQLRAQMALLRSVPSRTVVAHNDLVIKSRAAAVQWFDAAIAEAHAKA